MVKPATIQRASAVLFFALAGCQMGGIEWPDLSESAREQPAADEAPAAGSAQGTARAATTARESARPRETAPAPRAESAAATTREEVARTATSAREPAPGPATRVPGRGAAVDTDVRPTHESPAAAASEGVPAGDTRESVAPAATAAAVGERAAAEPVAGEDAPVAEPPRGSNLWLWILTLFVMALVGAVGWFFLQPPWKRGRWWRLVKAYVRDWREGGLDETPPGGTISAGYARPAEPKKPSLHVLKWRKRRPPEETKFADETSLHLEDLSGDESAGSAAQPKQKRKDYGDPLKSRDAEGSKRTEAAAGDSGEKVGKSKRRRKKTTNVTLPVISRDNRKRERG